MRTFLLFVGLMGLIQMAQAQFFTEVTASAGLETAVESNGVAVADYDGDGDLDIYFVAYRQYDPADSTTWNRLYRNEGNGSFSEVTDAAGVAVRMTDYPKGQMGNKFGAAWGDYDSDGDPDLFLTQVGPDILFRNEGNGTFSDMTHAAGLVDDPTDHDVSALWWDCDGDGDLDLYVSSWIGANTLYSNQGDGTFVDVTETSGLGDLGQTWTSIPLDADQDGDLDLYVVNDFGRNQFYINVGDGTFDEVTTLAGLEDEGHGMGVTVGDFNNDGIFDIYLTNDAAHFWNPLFVGRDDGTFYEDAEAMGVRNTEWGWGTEFFDYDHDGDVDLYAVNGFPVDPGTNRLFTNQLMQTGHATFQNDSAISGADGERDARGLVTFDYDNDGDLDLLVANWEGPAALYRNDAAQGEWLQVELVGTTSNRAGVGAKLRIEANGQTQYRQHDGADFLGQSVVPVHVGLGSATMVQTLTVQWPGGGEDIIHNVAAGQRITIVQGQGVTVASEEGMQLESFRLAGVYPNPVQDAATLLFEASKPDHVELTVYDALGRTVHAQTMPATLGTNRVVIKAEQWASGLYHVRLRQGDTVRAQSLLRVK